MNEDEIAKKVAQETGFLIYLAFLRAGSKENLELTRSYFVRLNHLRNEDTVANAIVTKVGFLFMDHFCSTQKMILKSKNDDEKEENFND